MVARMRPWNLEGMFGPRAEARAHAARGSAALGAGIERGLDAFGEGLVDRRKEAESKRRFGIEKGFEERRLRVAEHGAALDAERMDILREEKLEKAAAADGLLDNIVQMSERFGVMGALGVSPSDKEWGDFNASIDALGGQQAVAGALQVREKNAGALPTAEQDDIFDLDARMRQNAEARTQVDALMKQVGTMTKGRTGPKAMLAWTKLLNAKGMLDAEGASLQRRYALAGKQQVKAEQDAAREQQRIENYAAHERALPQFRAMLEAVDLPGEQKMALEQSFLSGGSDPRVDMTSLLTEARQFAGKTTPEEKAAELDRLDRALGRRTRGEVDAARVAAEEEAKVAKANAAAERQRLEAERDALRDENASIRVNAKLNEFTTKRAEAGDDESRAIVDHDTREYLRNLPAGLLERLSFDPKRREWIEKQIGRSLGGAAAPTTTQALPAPAAQAPAPQQAQRMAPRDAAAQAFRALPREQQTRANWQRIKAQYCGPGG